MTFEELYAENERLKKELSLLRGIEKDDFFNLSVDFLCTIFGRRFLQVNPAIVNALGYPKSALLSKNLTEFLHPDDIEIANKMFLQFAKNSGELHEFEVRFRKIDGEYITIAWQAHINSKRVAYAVGRDVTQHRQMEALVQQSENLFKAIFNSSSYLYVVIDKNFSIIKLNERAKRTSYIFFGIHLKVGSYALDAIQPEKREEFKARLYRVLNGQTNVFERKVTDRLTNTDYWFQITLAPLYVNHQIEGVCYAAVDISIQKRQEIEIQQRLQTEYQLSEELSTHNEELMQMVEELRATEDSLIASERKAKEAQAEALITKERIEHIINNIDDHYFWVIDPHQLEFLYVSHNIEHLLMGYDKNVLQDIRTCLQVIHPEDLSSVLEWQKKIFKGENIPAAFRLYNGIGEMRWFHTFPKAVFDEAGNLLHIEGLSIDVTEAKVAEFALQARALEYSSIFEQAQVGILQLDFDFQFIKCNQKMVEILRINPENVQQYNAKNFYQKDFAHQSESMLGKVLSGEIQEYTQERKFRRLDGEEFWTLISASMVRDIHQKPLYILCIVQDISALKETQTLLDKKKEELDAFFYNVSHALRGPLRTILGLYEVVLLEPTQEQSLYYFSLVADTAQKLSRLLDNLTRISEIRKSATEPTLINFQELISQVITMFNYLPNYEVITWKINVNVQSNFVANPSLVQLIFEKLLENSIVYTQSFVIPIITINVYDKHQHLFITVQDNGQGIAAEQLPHLAEIFKRGNNDSKGAGLGLYAVRNALEILGGSIGFESELGKGTKVMIKIPLL
jgi:PAS domain S-box-containing protein